VLVSVVEAFLGVAIKNQPRPGMLSYWPGTGLFHSSTTLDDSSFLLDLNHLCGAKAFWVATKRLGAITMVVVKWR